MYGAGDVRVENVPDAHLVEPTDALVRVTRAGICGSDLWPYKSMEPTETGRRMGHEFVGVVEAVGGEVRTIRTGDLVVSPFLWSDGSCVFCQQGLQSACLHGGRYGFDDVDGGQGEAVRVPQADGTLVALPVGDDDALMPSLLTLADVMGTGHHAAVAARVAPGGSVAVVGRFVSRDSSPPGPAISSSVLAPASSSSSSSSGKSVLTSSASSSLPARPPPSARRFARPPGSLRSTPAAEGSVDSSNLLGIFVDMDLLSIHAYTDRRTLPSYTTPWDLTS
jgi:hypothetical protein